MAAEMQKSPGLSGLFLQTINTQQQIHVLSLLRSLHVLAECDFKLCKNRSAPPRGA